MILSNKVTVKLCLHGGKRWYMLSLCLHGERMGICPVCVYMGKEGVYVQFLLTWGKRRYKSHFCLNGERGGVWTVCACMRELRCIWPIFVYIVNEGVYVQFLFIWRKRGYMSSLYLHGEIEGCMNSIHAYMRERGHVCSDVFIWMGKMVIHLSKTGK